MFHKWVVSFLFYLLIGIVHIFPISFFDEIDNLFNQRDRHSKCSKRMLFTNIFFIEKLSFLVSDAFCSIHTKHKLFFFAIISHVFL